MTPAGFEFRLDLQVIEFLEFFGGEVAPLLVSAVVTRSAQIRAAPGNGGIYRIPGLAVQSRTAGWCWPG